MEQAIEKAIQAYDKELHNKCKDLSYACGACITMTIVTKNYFVFVNLGDSRTVHINLNQSSKNFEYETPDHSFTYDSGKSQRTRLLESISPEEQEKIGLSSPPLDNTSDWTWQWALDEFEGSRHGRRSQIKRALAIQLDRAMATQVDRYKDGNPIPKPIIYITNGYKIPKANLRMVNCLGSLGDSACKSYQGNNSISALSNRPYVDVIKRDPKKTGKQYLLLACDGVWDHPRVMSYATIAHQLQPDEPADTQTVVNSIVKSALSIQTNTDNISALLVDVTPNDTAAQGE